MKKIISFLLLLAILVTLPSTALALDLESDSLSEKLYISSYDCPTQYASFAEETVHLFLESSEFSELSPCYLGNAFTFSNSGSNVYYFPIYYSNRIICLLRVYSNEQGEISGVLSKGFASELNEIAPFTSITDPLNIYFNDRPVYIVMHRQVGTEHAYHAVVLCGYDDTSGMLRIWNPWYQYYETIYSLSNYVPAENRNRTYTYTKTIYNWA